MADDGVDGAGGGGGQTGVAAVERGGVEGDTQGGRLTVGQLLGALLHRQILTGGVRGRQTEAGGQAEAGLRAGTDGVPGVVLELRPPVVHLVGHDAGVVQLARDQRQLLTDSPSPHLLVHRVWPVLGPRVELGVLQDLPLSRGEPLAEVQHPVAELSRVPHPPGVLQAGGVDAAREAAGALIEDVFYPGQGQLVPLEGLHSRQEVKLGLSSVFGRSLTCSLGLLWNAELAHHGVEVVADSVTGHEDNVSGHHLSNTAGQVRQLWVEAVHWSQGPERVSHVPVSGDIVGAQCDLPHLPAGGLVDVGEAVTNIADTEVELLSSCNRQSQSVSPAGLQSSYLTTHRRWEARRLQ